MSFATGHALLIGVGALQSNTTYALPKVAAEAHALADTLRDPALCGYLPDRVCLLHNAQATRAAIIAALDDIAARVSEDDTVLLYYGGDSAPGPHDYCLTTYDAQLAERRMAQGGLELALLLEKLRAIRASRVLLLCNAMQLPADFAPALVTSGPGRVVITACRSTQASFVGEGLFSIFGQALLDGLRGEGVVARGGYISSFDLYTALYDRVVEDVKTRVPELWRRRYGEQEPELTIHEGQAAFAVALHRGATPDATAADALALAPWPVAAAVRVLTGTAPVAAAAAPPSPAPVAAAPAADAAAPSAAAAPPASVGGDRVSGDKLGGDKVIGDKVSVAQSYGDVVTGDKVTVYGGYSQGYTPRLAAPAPGRYYTPRPEAEAELRAALLEATDQQPVVVLWGNPGTGKSEVAAQVARDMYKAGQFQGGVLWSELGNRSVGALLGELLGQVRPGQGRDDQPEATASAFWSAVNERPAPNDGPLLVVIDSVTTPAQLAALQPPLDTPSRLLAITPYRFDDPALHVAASYRVGQFAEPQAIELLVRVLGRPYFDSHESVLRQILPLLDYLPQRVYSTAMLLRENDTSPAAVLRSLTQGNPGGELLVADHRQELELLTQTLPADQLRLLELTAIFGDGSWASEMLAAVALRASNEVRRGVQRLVDLDVVTFAGERYRAKPSFRDFARQRLQQYAAYELHAAGHLLARYCLDIAQDRATALLSSTASNALPPTKEQIIAFRDALEPEVSHIQQVFAWATTRQEWELLRRFAYLPLFGLARGVCINGMNLRSSMLMSTLERLSIHGAHTNGVSIFGCFVGWDLVLSEGRTVHIGRPQNARLDDVIQRSTLPPAAASGPAAHREVHLDLTASHLIEGSLADIELIDVVWQGVRAPRLLGHAVDLVNGSFLACDLSGSVWVGCDARRAALTGSNLRGALLQRVKLRGANLQNVDLSDAVLDNVDLRGADLTGATLRGATLRGVALHGAQLDGVTWTGVRLSTQGIKASLEGLDRALEREIERVAQQPGVGVGASDLYSGSAAREARILSDALICGPDYRDRGLTIQGEKIWVASLADADLRVAQLRRSRLDSVAARRADLRLANLEHATLYAVDLNDADLRLARLDDASLEHVRLERANLDGAQLRRARLHNVVLNDAHLSAASLDGASLANTQLQRANFNAARLTQASLRQSTLKRATLIGAHLAHADLSQANLSGADLSAADLGAANLTAADLSNCTLREAVLAGALLRQATLEGANLSGADLSDANLSDANLADADLREANLRGARLSLKRLTNIGRLGGATLPDGRVVAVVRGPRMGANGLPHDQLTPFAELLDSFTEVDLAGHELLGTYLDGTFRTVNFARARLSYVKIAGSMRGCFFEEARLSYTRIQATMDHCRFARAQLLNVSVERDLVGCDFSNARLRRTNTTRDLQDCDLSNATLREVGIGGSLQGSVVRGAICETVNIYGDAVGCDFREARLRDVKIYGDARNCLFSAPSVESLTIHGRLIDCTVEGELAPDATFDVKQTTASDVVANPVEAV
jgi:uncharacterized protein YjbI with pentapeptide repeats